MILIVFYVDRKIYASRTLPCVPRRGDVAIFKGKKYLVAHVDWVFSSYSVGYEYYVKISLIE